ncbi:MAG: EAL domain-containing protein, partial [Campylobacterota bacterium]|nr:EAL domain-containing protein [Campylobacterota bacterium]
VFFYHHQNQFSTHYKQVLSDLQNIVEIEHVLTYNILQNTLYLYSNQDSIANNRNRLTQALQEATKNKLFHDENYKTVLKELDRLASKTEKYYYQLDSFLSLNAGIKNSFIYINTHAYNAIIKENHKPEYIQLSQHISKAFVTAGRTLDADLLQNLEGKIHQLQLYNESLEKPSRAMGLFILHVKFIYENFPAYIETLNYLLSEPLLVDIASIQDSFNVIASSDKIALDRFALSLMILFVLGTIHISALLLHIRRKNIKLEKTQNELQNSLSHDQLTGLKNRFSFEKELTEFKSPALILLNIDNFKHVNDFYGIEIGNFILEQCSKIIQDVTLHQFDEQIFRLGGDDFGIIFEEASIKATQHNSETIIRAINTHIFSINNLKININVSAAISHERPLLENANMALKHIKLKANEYLITYSDDLGLKEAVSHNIEISNILKKAIEEDQITPYFQPIYHLEHQKIEKYEALVRIQCSDGSILKPSVFLPIAEETAYYSDITRIMIQKSMQYFKDLPYRFSVNIAMQDLRNMELMSVIKETLDQDKQTAKRLDFELLESEHIDDIAYVNNLIREIKSYGCRVAIDDFGSGYSNFSYLTSLDIDILKIDGSLIKDIHHNTKSYHIVKTIIEFAILNDLEVTAEYV